MLRIYDAPHILLAPQVFAEASACAPVHMAVHVRRASCQLS